MPTQLELIAASILEQAAQARVGLLVRVIVSEDTVSPTLRAKQILYRFRKELGDPRYLQIQVRLSPDNSDRELWLINTASDATSEPESDSLASLTVEDFTDIL